ncbi:VIP peptides-like isoform X2 [Chiloscyllium plagiosum]|uniref:VIP peptides-like isoform X2 n=1 Tax=Chiloscyllium plagiosum TaxID=36176 RepID=UPI001CB8319B|nr:VIP peptides-like isoform X2 [Chiloscyllium plagiosum]
MGSVQSEIPSQLFLVDYPGFQYQCNITYGTRWIVTLNNSPTVPGEEKDIHPIEIFAVYCERLPLVCPECCWSRSAVILCWATIRLRNAVGFDGQSSEDQSQSPVRADSDIYQNPSSDSDKVYYQLSASMPRAKRHSDAIFTNEYSKLLGEIAARKYLESLMGKRTQDEHNASKRHSDAVFTHMYTTLLQEKAAKEFLERIANGQTSQQDPNSADTLDNPSPVENYVSDAI